MTAVQQSIVVEATPDRAFEVFTAGIDTWWPREHTIGSEPLARQVVELREGGRAYGVGSGGEESDWGRVLVYDPPRRVVISWDITVAWEHQTDPSKTSEIEVTFTPEGGGTRVDLEHRHLERHGEGWEAMRDSLGSGWGGTLELYAGAVMATV